MKINHYISETMNPESAPISYAETENDIQQSSLSGLFKKPPTYTTFIDGYWEREVAFIMWTALKLKGDGSIMFLVGLGIVFVLGG